MSNKLMTIEQASKEIQRLRSYIDLFESYTTDTLDKQVIKEYAIYNSASKVASILSHRGVCINKKPITKDQVIQIINSRPKDDLHKIIKNGYREKTKHLRRKNILRTN